jgi:hypothetical protein
MHNGELAYISGKRKEYLKDGTKELESDSRNKTIRDWYKGVN